MIRLRCLFKDYTDCASGILEAYHIEMRRLLHIHVTMVSQPEFFPLLDSLISPHDCDTGRLPHHCPYGHLLRIELSFANWLRIFSKSEGMLVFMFSC